MARKSEAQFRKNDCEMCHVSAEVINMDITGKVNRSLDNVCILSSFLQYHSRLWTREGRVGQSKLTNEIQSFNVSILFVMIFSSALITAGYRIDWRGGGPVVEWSKGILGITAPHTCSSL